MRSIYWTRALRDEVLTTVPMAALSTSLDITLSFGTGLIMTAPLAVSLCFLARATYPWSTSRTTFKSQLQASITEFRLQFHLFAFSFSFSSKNRLNHCKIPRQVLMRLFLSNIFINNDMFNKRSIFHLHVKTVFRVLFNSFFPLTSPSIMYIKVDSR